jgi:hypothetical protein
MKKVIKGKIVLLAALTLIPLSTLSAQVKVAADFLQLTDFNSLPGLLPIYSPQSGTFKVTMGTILADMDRFMSTVEYGRIRGNSLAYAGYGEDGLSLGYGGKFKNIYLGASYGGGFIEEAIGWIVNKEALTLQLRDTMNKADGVLLSDGGTTDLTATAISNNNINLLFGVGGVFGLKMGVNEYIKGTAEDKLKGFESSIRPSLEFGFNFPIGPVRIKPALRGGLDLHRYFSKETSILEITEPELGLPDSAITKTWTVNQMKYQDFMEISGGITLGFDFGKGDTRTEFDLIADGAYRMYPSFEASQVLSTWVIRDPKDLNAPVIGSPLNHFYENPADITIDLRIKANPTFVLNIPFTDIFTLGLKANAGVAYDMVEIKQSIREFAPGFYNDPDVYNDDPDERNSSQQNGSSIAKYPGTIESSITHMGIVPEFDVGANFNMWPDHIAFYTGFGIVLFNYDSIATDQAGRIDVTKSWEIPSVKFALGFSLNFIKEFAIDFLVVQSGFTVDGTKFATFLTFKK